MFRKYLKFLLCTTVLVNALKTSVYANSDYGNASGENPSRSSWTWVDNCHVLSPHKLTDFGTNYSAFTAYQQQTVLNDEEKKGKTRGDFLYITTIKQDLWHGGSLIIYGEGGDGKGIDPLLNGTLSTNATIEEANVYLSRMFLLNNFSDGRLQIVAGKIALSDFFDTCAVANCETRGFLASPLVNNPSIPFPDNGLGGAFKLNADSFYFQAGFADDRAKGTTNGFHTAFCEDSKLFQIYQLGLLSELNGHKGTYRFIYWHNSVSQNSDGLGLSFDQQIADNATVFSRYGYTDNPLGDITHFWSAGGRVNGLWSQTKKNFLEIAVARSISASHSNRGSKTLMEMNYSAHVNKSLTITPLLQILTGLHDKDTAIIAGFRLVWVL